VATIFVPLFFTVFARRNRMGEGTPVRLERGDPESRPQEGD
jgi:hypothetical protein